MDAPPGGDLPLIALLGRAHDALETAFDARLRSSDFSDLSLAHSRNVLRHLGRGGCCRSAHLAERSGVSKQALSLQIAQLEKSGYLVSASDPGDGRAKVLELTERGRAAQQFVARTMREMDDLWRAEFGDEAWSVLRGQLRRVIES